MDDETRNRYAVELAGALGRSALRITRALAEQDPSARWRALLEATTANSAETTELVSRYREPAFMPALVVGGDDGVRLTREVIRAWPGDAAGGRRMVLHLPEKP